jgi:S1-C subfamily serine protease
MSASPILRGRTALHLTCGLALACLATAPLSAQEGDVAPVTSPSTSDVGSPSKGKLPTSAMPGGGREATQAPATPVEALSARVLESVVKLYGAGGFTGIPGYGSGVIVDERGFVLTAWSIALDSPDLHIVTARGKRLNAKLWSADAGLGIALVKVDPLGASLKPLRLAQSRGLRPGTALLSVGNPFGFVYGAEKLSIMKGVLTATVNPNEGGARMVRLPLGLTQVLLTDIPNNPGSQGGALLTLEGELVGILGRLVESRATNTLVNFAVPADEIRPFLQAGLRQRKARPAAKAAPLLRPKRGGPKLGIRLQRTHLVRSPLPYVEVVRRGSAAERAGIKPDDLVFKIGRRTIRSCRDYDEAVATLQPGAKVRLTLKRGEACLNLTLEVPSKEAKEGPK